MSDKMIFNGVEVTGVCCENCDKYSHSCNYKNFLDFCGCVRVNNKYGNPRIILETKGTIVIKKREMYDAEYESDEEDEDEDEEDEEEEEDEE